MFWRIFQKIEPAFIRLYKKLSQPPIPNLRGDRDVEYSWIAINIPSGSGKALDFGCGQGWMGLLAARRGYDVIAIDLQPVDWYYKHPNLKFIQGDILKLNFPPQSFDLVINCSSIEHVGLKGRYSVVEDRPDGDIEAMQKIRRLLKPEGFMLLTIPVGKDVLFPPLHRVYGRMRLPKLLEGYRVDKREYWIKDNQNCWISTDEYTALNQKPHRYSYGLGCFVLRPKLDRV
ncbi:MAG: hypothetical protein DRP84_08565 [Spirochaetes bacterium]|nr:MAG: hypothetical protein DRP84_08565 [Spirochaetota bacterium]